MSILNRALASLRLIGDDLDPDQITRLLGAPATRAWRKGDDIRMRPERPPNIARHGHWRIEATPTEPADLDTQVLELLSGLTNDLQVWRALSEQHRMSLFCGWFMTEGNEGVEIAPGTLVLLGERGIALDLDIYGPDRDE